MKAAKLVWLTIGAAVCEKNAPVVPIDLELDLGHGGEPPHLSHVALRDGVVTAAGPPDLELVLANLDSKNFKFAFYFPQYFHVVSPRFSKTLSQIPKIAPFPFVM